MPTRAGRPEKVSCRRKHSESKQGLLGIEGKEMSESVTSTFLRGQRSYSNGKAVGKPQGSTCMPYAELECRAKIIGDLQEDHQAGERMPSGTLNDDRRHPGRHHRLALKGKTVVLLGAGRHSRRLATQRT